MEKPPDLEEESGFEGITRQWWRLLQKPLPNMENLMPSKRLFKAYAPKSQAALSVDKAAISLIRAYRRLVKLEARAARRVLGKRP